ncbi:MAG TPA: hypothetical protein VKM72_35640 [Thermoanaerobaculia bacterium]|nr:hypothetical protein [Thermoanaerobaculia bacterium]
MVSAGELSLPDWLTAMRDDDRNGETFPWETILLARLEEARGRLDRERAEAPGLCAELLARAPDSVSDAGAETVEPRFRTWGVCEELLRQSTLEENPFASSRLASLALAVTRGLDEQHDKPLVRDLEARVWASLGSARLRSGDLAGAGEALREGALRLVEGTGDLLVDACLLEFEAAVREAQGGLREAAGLLRQAQARYREIGETTLAERAAQARERVLRALNPS